MLCRACVHRFADIMVYDEESDRHVHIPFATAMEATCYGHAEGPKGDLFNLAGKTAADADVQRSDDHYAKVFSAAGGPLKLSDLLTPASAVTASAGPPAVVGVPARSGYTAGNKADDAAIEALVTGIKTLVAFGVWVPVEIVICRPFIEHLSLSAIVAVAGRDTGATLFGPAGTLAPSPHWPLASTDPRACPAQTCRSAPTPRSRPSKGAFTILPPNSLDTPLVLILV